jgi:hypothetical protein
MSTASDPYFYNLKTVRSDPRIAYVLLREARSRTLERVFGVPRDQQFLLTLILLGMAGRAVAVRSRRALDSAPGRPSRNGLLIGTSLLDEAAHMLAGDSTPDAPLVGSLVAFALLVALVRPGVHDIRAALRSAQAELARIPRYIIRLNRPEEPQSSRG